MACPTWVDEFRWEEANQEVDDAERWTSDEFAEGELSASVKRASPRALRGSWFVTTHERGVEPLFPPAVHSFTGHYGSWFTATHEQRAMPLRELLEAIKRWRSIGQLDDDWDGEGSPGYANETIERAIRFVLRVIGLLDSIPLPRLNPAGHGSIDLYWEDGARRLLINVPAGGEEASYYGEDRSGNTIGGVIRSDAMGRQVVDWLIRAG